MAIADLEAKLDAARTRFQTVAGDLFGGDQIPGTWQLVAEQIDAEGEDNVTLLDAGPTRKMRQWIGEKQFGAYRIYDKKIEILPYESSLEIRRTDLRRDRVGVINKRIDTFLADQALTYDYEVWDKLLGNPTGIDGVSLLNNSHPHGSGGGTWDNLVTDALSHSAYRTGKSAMRVLKNEHGRFFGLQPTHLFVGPDLEHTAKEIVGADRTVAIDATAAEATASVVAITQKTNVYEGDVTVVVVPHFENGTNDSDWLLMDLSKPVKPMALAIERDIEVHEQMSMDAEQRFLRDVFRASAEADFAADGAYPQVIYGNLS